jgi:hypothetical protein
LNIEKSTTGDEYWVGPVGTGSLIKRTERVGIVSAGKKVGRS